MKKILLTFSLICAVCLLGMGLTACGTTQYKLSWTIPSEGVESFLVKDGNTTLTSGTKVNKGTEVTISWTAAEDYTMTVKTGGTDLANGARHTVNTDTVLTITATQNQTPFEGTVVTTRAELLEAVLTENANIRLGANITETDDLVINKNQDISFKLDLYGYSIASEIDLYNRADPTKSLTAEITDSVGTGAIGTKDNQAVWYGLYISGNNKVDVTLKDLKAVGFEGGLYTSSNTTGAKITATNCTFEGNALQDNQMLSTLGRTGSTANNLIKHTGVGAYIAGYGTYKFEDCIFTGNTGISTKNGEIELDSCTITAAGEYVSPAAWTAGTLHTGNGIFMNLSDGAKILNIVINGGSVVSTSGYAIEEAVTAGSGHDVSIDISNDTVLSGEKGETHSQSGLFD